MRELVLIAVGGAFGAVCRHAANLGVARLAGKEYALGTLAVNVFGCFVLGLLVELGEGSNIIPTPLRIPIAVGFLGALTTFSTFGHETFRHLEAGDFRMGLVNIAANMLLGLLAVWGGIMLGRYLLGVS